MAPRCRKVLIGVWGMLVALGIWTGTNPAWAQAILGPSTRGVADQGVVENVFLPPDRATLQNLWQAKALIEKGRYSEAVIKLRKILDAPEDFFFQARRQQTGYRSLKAEAQGLIGKMPAEGRRQYEEAFGARARRMLETAVAAGDVAGLANISRRYFHTAAGYQATFLLGLHHLDRGRSLAGALVLKRLLDFPDATADFEPALSLSSATCWLRSGAPEKARQVLVDLKRRRSGREILIAGKRTPLFENETEVLDWLREQVGPQGADVPKAEDWVMHRGNPLRNAASRGSAPLLSLQWHLPAADDPLLEGVIAQYRRFQVECGHPVLSGLHPLVIDDVVLMRTFRNLLAVDFRTGKRLWEVPAEEPAVANPLYVNLPQANRASRQVAQIAHRIWNDSLFGTLSSDGRLVFSVEEAAGEPSRRNPNERKQIFIGAGGGAMMVAPSQTRASNRLVAQDLHTGKRRWHLGGPRHPFPLRLPEAFFLGPPLPLMGHLYVLAERRGEIRLLALEAETGDLLWTQQLAVVDYGIHQDRQRSFIAATPSYADGILICPTSTGALVAVELATRSLLWGYQYGRDGRNSHRNMINFVRVGAIRRDLAFGNQPVHWIDPAVCIAEDRVLATPLESHSLHCLNLADGELLWKQPRVDDLYIACIHQGTVVLVGRRQVRALKLADGKPAWKGRTIALPKEVMPSGHGFYNGTTYFLPLDSGQVAELDLAEGKIRRFSKSQNGDIPGNLVCYQGRILSQNTQGLSLFYQSDVARAEVEDRLVQNPDDAEALRLHGEILWDAGQRDEAVAALRRAYAGQRDPHTRELLREALFEGLEEAFAAYRRQTAEIESLLDEDPVQQARYLRMMARGLQHCGEIRASFEQTLKLVDLQPDQYPLEYLSKMLSVRRDRWVQGHLAKLRSEAAPEVAAQMDAALSARWKAAQSAAEWEGLQRFLSYFENQPQAAQARAEYIARLQKSNRLREAEWALWRYSPENAAKVHPSAVAAVTEMYRQAGQTAAAAAGFRWLLRHFPETPCLEQKTPRELLAALPADDPLRRQIESPDPWPMGKVKAQTGSHQIRNLHNYYGCYPLELRGSPGPYFENVSLVFNRNQHLLQCLDGLGHTRWQISLREGGKIPLWSYNYNSYMMQAWAWGHLLMLSVQDGVLVLDTLGADKNHAPKIIWPRGNSKASENQGATVRSRVVPAAAALTPFFSAQSRQNSNVAFITGRYVCFQRLRSLNAFDPLTGQILWERQGIPLRSMVFGDEEYLFVLPPDKLEALVLRAVDGELLGTRKIASNQTVFRRTSPITPLPEGVPSHTFASKLYRATFGRRILRWKTVKAQKHVELFDPWTQKALWSSKPFPAGAQSCLVADEALGVLAPSGKFTLLRLPDGQLLAEAVLQPEPQLKEVLVFGSESRYFVLAHNNQANISQPAQPLQGTVSKWIRSGKLYALDPTGKLLWPEPVKIGNQRLLTSQPPGLPVIVFAALKYHHSRQGGRQVGRHQVSVMMVDKRTGRVVYHGKFPSHTSVFTVTGDAEKKTIELTLQRNKVTLAFTNQPWPSSQESGDKAGKKSTAAESLLKSLQRANDRIY